MDLDAFFASVEQLDHPEWRGKPVIVGGDADSRGVVSTCSYEARKFGVRSAMPAAVAHKLCPDAIWTHGRHGRYKEISDEVMCILDKESPFVQQVSIDEAFIDISPTRVNRENPIDIARRIQNTVDELGISCSIGLGTTKTIAKIASDIDKPHGLTVVMPGSERTFLNPLPIRAISGIGPAAEQKLTKFGIKTLEDLADSDMETLRPIFGKNAEMMRSRARGVETSAVNAHRDTKSVSKEITFAKDITGIEEVKSAVSSLSIQVARRCRRKGLQGTEISLKVRTSDWCTKTAQVQLGRPIDNEADFIEDLYSLIDQLYHPGMKIRLLGVTVSGFGKESLVQDDLFGFTRKQANDKRHRLTQATDSLKDRFGEESVMFGNELRHGENSTNTKSKTVDG